MMQREWTDGPDHAALRWRCPIAAAHRCCSAALSALRALLLLLLCVLLQMSGSNKKMKIDELQHTRKVKRSGTSGSKKVAKGGGAVAELAEAIAKLSDGARTNSVIESFNQLVKHYDAVILVRAMHSACADTAEGMSGTRDGARAGTDRSFSVLLLCIASAGVCCQARRVERRQ